MEHSAESTATLTVIQKESERLYWVVIEPKQKYGISLLLEPCHYLVHLPKHPSYIILMKRIEPRRFFKALPREDTPESSTGMFLPGMAGGWFMTTIRKPMNASQALFEW